MNKPMKYTTKAGPRYRVKFIHLGNQVVKGGFKAIAEAQAWEKQERLRLDRKEQIKASPGRPNSMQVKTNLTFLDLSNQYLLNADGRKMKNTISTKKNIMREFLGFVNNNIEVSDVTRVMVQEFMRNVYESKGAKCANRYLRELSSIFNFGIMQNNIAFNPCRGIEKYSEEDAERYVPSKEEVYKLLMAAEPWEKELLNVIIGTGARIGEVLNLKWSEVNIERGVVSLYTRKRKNGNREARTVTMGAMLKSVMETKWRNRDESKEYVFINPNSGNKYYKEVHVIKHFMKRLCERAGVNHFGFHSLRHYVSVRLADSGKCSTFELQRLLGHQRPSTTEIYLRSLAPDLKNVADVLDGELSMQHDKGDLMLNSSGKVNWKE